MFPAGLPAYLHPGARTFDGDSAAYANQGDDRCLEAERCLAI